MFDSDHSDNDEACPTKKSDKEDDSSSSESDIENYLQKPEDLNLNSTFFKVNLTPVVNKNKQSDQSKTALSDSDSDDALSIYVKKDEPKPSTSKATVESSQKSNVHDHLAFKDQNKHVLELEDAKKQVEAYLARRRAEQANNTDEVTDLLALGEKQFDLAKDLAEVGFHPSDFESGNESEKEDWEEVQESQEKSIIPKEGVEITVSMPNTIRKKKGIDLMAALKRRMNRIKKENQVYVHKVHLLCWIAHGNYVNNVLNKENIMAMALSLLPTKDCYPPTRTNLKYLEQITKWYNKSMKYQPADSKEKENFGELEDMILAAIGTKVATSATMLVYIFVCMLRALGMQCRLVLSLQVEPLRPPSSELCSLKNEANIKVKKDESKECVSDECKVAKSNVKKSSKPSQKKSNKNSTKNLKETPKKSPALSKKMKKNETEPKIQVVDKNPDTIVSGSPTKSSDRKSGSKRKLQNDTKTVKPNLGKLMKSSSTESETKETALKSPQYSPKQDLKAAAKPDKPNLSKLKKGSSIQSETTAKRQTRSRTKAQPTEDDDDYDDFKKPNTLLATSTKPLRSKSASDVTSLGKKAKESLNVPKDKKIKRSKSATTQLQNLKKSSVLSDIDATVAALEALESAETANTQEKNKDSSSSCISDDDGFVDRASWRQSKSPQILKQHASSSNISNKSPSPKVPHGKHILRARKPSPDVNPALMDSMFQSDDERVMPKNKNKIKVKVPQKRNLPQLDGHFDESLTTDGSDDEMYTKSCSIVQIDGADDKPSKPKLKALKSPKTATQAKNLSQSSPDKYVNSSPSSSKKSSTSSYFSPEKNNVKDVIVDLVKKSMREEKQKAARRSYKEAPEDSDSDFAPEEHFKKKKPSPVGKVKKRVLPRKQLEALAKEKAEMEKERKKGIDIWVEVFLEEEEKWISADVVSGKVHCIKDIYSKASHPVSYILTWDNANKIKDVTKRYCSNWNTVTRKLRTEPDWWAASLKPYIGVKTARDKEEDEDLARQQLDQPLPKTISEYKDHPLYVLKRHLLKFQALYPADPSVLGFVRNEEVYSRDCVYILHSRDIWLKHAKVVKPGEQPYKIVKARPKYDKLSNSMITDQLLEIFGVWQVQDYEPPTAQDGIVPRNAYGNVELFKPCMLPKKCVHLQLPGLKKVATKLRIDCAPAVTGFDFHGGWNHVIYDGFIVCEEFKDVLIAAWEQEQDEIVKREQEKYEKRVFGNWRRLIKAALIRRRLKLRYDFSEPKPDLGDNDSQEERDEVKEESPPKKKRPKFMSRK